MWNSLITPQPNKFIEIMMPVQPIPKTTEILIDDEAWYLVDYDKVSVPEIIYMSFTESKVNELRDSVEEQIANYDKIQEWHFEGLETISVTLGEIVEPQFTAYCDGIPTEIEPQYFIEGNLRKQYDAATGRNKIIADGNGTITIKYNDIQFVQQVIVTEPETLEMFIEGPDKLRVTESATYKVVANWPITEDVLFTLSDNSLAVLNNIENVQCTVSGNEKNKLGTITLTATVEGISCTKEIQIISLWQVI